LAEIISVTGISLELDEVQIEVNEQLQILAQIQPNTASNQAVVWSSNDPSIVTVDTQGNLVGVSPGITTVIVTSNDGGYTAEATVTVVAETFQVTGIAINPVEAEIPISLFFGLVIM